MTYGKRLKAAIEAAGRERKEVAQACGCTVQNIGMVLTAPAGVDRTLSAATHAKAARFLNVDPYWLATGEGQMRTDAAADDSTLSTDAKEIASYFDKLHNKVARTRSYVGAMSLILRELGEMEPPPDGKSIPEPAPAENPKKQSV